jgi:molybdenum ABC transporter molybdate-binding protein
VVHVDREQSRLSIFRGERNRVCYIEKKSADPAVSRTMLRPSRRAGSVRVPLLIFLSSAVLLSGLLVVLFADPLRWFSRKPKQTPLVVYCAAGLKGPVEEIAKAYEAEYGTPVQIQYGGSQTLLSQLELAEGGDLYIPADDSYLELARKKDLIAETVPLARMRPVLAVPKGNPRKLRTIDDLLRDDVKVSLANPDAAAIGLVTRARLSKSGHWQRLEKKLTVVRGTVSDSANDVRVGGVDAAIIWDALVRQIEGLEAVELPDLAGEPSLISAAVLKRSRQPTAALRFARYLGARDRGLPTFKKHGYEPVDGDVWAETPEIRIYAGAMLRPAIEETVTEFERREGVKVARVYNGCGILVAQMRSEEHGPDAYFACDVSFMKQVQERFEPPVTLSANELVILVPKGNPHGIEKLADLGKSGLRVGIGHEKQCALGVLTQETFVQGRVQQEVMKNVKVQAPAGDLLVNQLRAGSLDAVVAYRSNAAAAGDELEAKPVQLPCAIAEQPLAVGKDSDHKHTTARLMIALRSPESRRRFEELNFTWKDGTR